MTIQELFDVYNGLWIETNKSTDDSTNDQCVDLWRVYNLRVVGGTNVFGNAVDIWDNYPKDFYDKIVNTPTSVPQLGDVIIWGKSYGKSGHIAVCTDGANTSEFTSFDQNDPIGQPCHFQPHKYTSVLGWLRPKSLPEKQDEFKWFRGLLEENLIHIDESEPRTREAFDESKKYEQAIKERDKALRDLSEAKGDSAKFEESFNTANKELGRKNGEIIDLQGKVTSRDTTITILRQQLADCGSPVTPEPENWLTKFINTIFGKR